MYTLHGHGESYRVARAPFSVFGADLMDTSDAEDLDLLLQADADEEAHGPCFNSRHSLDPIGGEIQNACPHEIQLTHPNRTVYAARK